MSVVFTRCAACGSSRVVADTVKEGYSLGKGLAGVALFGAGGSAMGVNGKEKMYYHCPDCGQVLSYSMPFYIVKSISSYLIDPKNNKAIKDMYMKTYPNVEWDVQNPNEKLSKEEVADFVWNYYLGKKVSLIKEEVICEFLKDKIKKVFSLSDAIEVLEEKGVVTTKYVGDDKYLVFYDNAEDIEYNISTYRFNQSIDGVYDFEEKASFINKFCLKNLGKKFSLSEFKEKLMHYILDSGYILKSGEDDDVFVHLFNILDNTFRIDVDKKKNTVFVNSLENASKLFMEAREKRAKERKTKINKLIPKLRKILEKEECMTEAMFLHNYVEDFEDGLEHYVYGALTQMVKEKEIFELDGVYSLKEMPFDGMSRTDFHYKYRAIDWMLKPENKKLFTKWDLYTYIEIYGPVKRTDICEKLGIDKSVGGQNFNLNTILNYYMFVDKSIVKVVEDNKVYYYTSKTYERILKERNDKEIEEKYSMAAKNYSHCTNIEYLEKYKNSLMDLGDYKDSKKIVEEIDNKILKLKEIKKDIDKKIEKNRIEQKKLEEEQEKNRLEQEEKAIEEAKKRDKKVNKVLLIIVPLIVIVLVGLSILLISSLVGIKNKNELDLKEQTEIREKMLTSFAEVSRDDINKLDDNEINEDYIDNWNEYSKYCGEFQYINGDNVVKFTSDFKMDEDGKVYLILTDASYSSDGENGRYPFGAIVNGVEYVFFDEENVVGSYSNRVVDNEGNNDFIEARMDFDDGDIIYTTGYYQTVTSSGKKENFEQTNKKTFKKVK